MLGWYAALRPGLMSADSLSIWRQVIHGHWVDLHPPAYTAAMWVSKALVGDPSLVTLGQSLLLAAGIVALCRSTIRLGAPRVLVVTVATALTLSPMMGGFSVSLWKDVPYTAALLFAVARVVDICRLRLEDGTAFTPVLRSLGGWLVGAAVLRQNGVLLALALAGLLMLVVPPLRRMLAVLAGVVVGVVVVLKLAVYPLMGVARSPTQSAVAGFLHDIAAVARTHPDDFDVSDRALMARIAPFETWRSESSHFGCSSANWEWSESFDWGRLEGRVGDYLRLWSEVAVEHPTEVMGNRACVGAMAFRPDTVGSVYMLSTGVDPNELGLRTRPLLHGLDDAAAEVLRDAFGSGVNWLLWRGPVWIYLAWGALGVAALRWRQPGLLLPAVPLLALQLSVFAVNPAQDARYMFAGLMAGALLLPLAAVRRPVAPPPSSAVVSRQEPIHERRLDSAAVMTFDAGGGDG